MARRSALEHKQKNRCLDSNVMITHQPNYTDGNIKGYKFPYTTQAHAILFQSRYHPLIPPELSTSWLSHNSWQWIKMSEFALVRYWLQIASVTCLVILLHNATMGLHLASHILSGQSLVSPVKTLTARLSQWFFEWANMNWTWNL